MAASMKTVFVDDYSYGSNERKRFDGFRQDAVLESGIMAMQQKPVGERNRRVQ